MKADRHTVEIDTDTDVRLREMAVECGQDVSAVLADAVALLDAMASAGPNVSEDVRRFESYRKSGLGVTLDEVKHWISSWGSSEELPRPVPRKVG